MDRKWLYRAGLVIVVVAFIVLLARISFVALKPDTARLDRDEAAAVGSARPADAVK
ncbi:MAG TPA: hypothetical protein VGI14_07495 [Casimicrobiaceae bacterium]|jgi:hypothetical protein